MKRTVLAIGLPKTGKTTFLAAFWDVVCSGEVVGSLRLAQTSGDMQYLNEIREAWADCKPITRTGPASDKSVSMLLHDDVANTSTTLAWTDMLGESFERQWTERAWTRPYQDLVDEAVGTLLFVHPAKVGDAPLIVEAQQAVPRLEQNSSTADRQPAREAAPPTTGVAPAALQPKPAAYDATKVATQVQLVDLLQFVDHRRRAKPPLRVALVVSAWDRVEKLMKVAPEAWFAERLPFLQQFLLANDERFDHRVFGVSAQGGEYTEADKLRAAHQSSRRIQVAQGEYASNDITAPVRWALKATALDSES